MTATWAARTRGLGLLAAAAVLAACGAQGTVGPQGPTAEPAAPAATASPGVSSDATPGATSDAAPGGDDHTGTAATSSTTGPQVASACEGAFVNLTTARGGDPHILAEDALMDSFMTCGSAEAWLVMAEGHPDALEAGTTAAQTLSAACSTEVFASTPVCTAVNAASAG